MKWAIAVLVIVALVRHLRRRSPPPGLKVGGRREIWLPMDLQPLEQCPECGGDHYSHQSWCSRRL